MSSELEVRAGATAGAGFAASTRARTTSLSDMTGLGAASCALAAGFGAADFTAATAGRGAGLLTSLRATGAAFAATGNARFFVSSERANAVSDCVFDFDFAEARGAMSTFRQNGSRESRSRVHNPEDEKLLQRCFERVFLVGLFPAEL